MGAVKKNKRTYNDLTIADRLLLKEKLRAMLGKFYCRYNSLHKITKFDINGNTTIIYSDHPASPHVFVTAEFEDWLEEFTPTKLNKKGEIIYDRRIIKPLDEDFSDNENDDVDNNYDEPEEENIYISPPENRPTMADVFPDLNTPSEPVESKPEKPIEMKEIKPVSVPIKKAVDAEIEDVLPIFDVYSFDNLTGELSRMMSEVLTADKVTPELIQKATTVNMLAGSIAKIHTDKISNAVLLAQNADAINKLLNPKLKK